MAYNETQNRHAPISATLAMNEMVQAMRADGKDAFHLGFGQAPFPAPAIVRNALRDNAGERSYLPVAGLPELCKAVSAHQARHTGIDSDAFDILIGPGSKMLLYAIQMAIPGDILLPVPSWVSYEPQAKMLGQRTIPVPMGLSDDGLTLDVANIDQAINQARTAGLNPTKLLINFPSNPTGLTFDNDALLAVTEACRRQNIILISDEIYGRLSFDHDYRSAASTFPEGAVVTTGLSKHLSLGGWRLGVSLVSRSVTGLYENLCHIASETWSCVAAPIQMAAVEGYAMHADVEKFVTYTTDIHAHVNRYIATRLRNFGVNCCLPQGGFYTWPDFGPVLGNNYTSSNAMAEALLKDYGVATLPGVCFGEPQDALRLRLSGCDYDGEHALKLWEAHGGTNVGDSLIEDIAPNIVSALNAIGMFVDNARDLTKRAHTS